MRILGFIQLAALAVTNLTLRARLPPKPSPGPFVDLSAFKNPAYTIWCLSGFVSFLGLYTVSPPSGTCREFQAFCSDRGALHSYVLFTRS